MAIRTKLVQSNEFLESCTHKNIFGPAFSQLYGLFGPRRSGRVTIGDDNFITAWGTERRLLLEFQDTDDAMIETTLTESANFVERCLRWIRTTYCSNVRLLLTKSYGMATRAVEGHIAVFPDCEQLWPI